MSNLKRCPFLPFLGLMLTGLGLAVTPASALTFTVNNLSDIGAGTLRGAITSANLVPGDDTIVFQAGLTGTINLTGSLPDITTNIDIQGPGANVVTINGGNTYKILTVTAGSTNSKISGLTFANGHDTTPFSPDFGGGGGGAIFLNDGTLAIDACAFTGNTSSNEGGAIDDYGALTITNSLFVDNTSVYGSAVNTLKNNDHPNQSLTMRNCTVTNSADTGTSLDNYGQMALDTITITGAMSTTIYSNTLCTLNNSIVALNDGTDGIGGSYTGAYNFIGGDPKFDPAGLTDNGGPTKTIGLQITSPCLNAGDPAYTGETYDQRGTPYNRIYAGRMDIGAFEARHDYLAARNFGFSEGNTSHSINYGVTLGAASSETIVVHYATADGTASAGTDYTATSGDLTFLPGETSKTIPITILGNTTDQDNRSFNLNFTQAGTPTVFLGDGTAVVTIADDDLAPKIYIVATSVPEGDTGTTNLDFTVKLNAASAKTVTVEAFSDNGAVAPKATPGIDYVTLSPTTLTFTPGQTTKTVTILVNGDTVAEQNENIRVNLRNPVNGYIQSDTKTGTGSILDDDTPPIPSISINDRSVNETETSRAVTFSVTLSQPTSVPVTVIYDQIPGTATDGADYTLGGGTLTFAPGETTKSITATILGDTIDENDETFAVNLSAPTNATIADGQGIGTIVDNDAAPSLSIDNVSQAEGNDGTTAFTFTVTLAGTTERTVSVDAYTAASSAPSATADVDYASVSPTTLTFAPGDTTKIVTVYVNGDTAVEANEKFAVRLTNVINATIKTAFGIGTIQNDDAPTLRAPSGQNF